MRPAYAGLATLLAVLIAATLAAPIIRVLPLPLGVLLAVVGVVGSAAAAYLVTKRLVERACGERR